MGKPKTIRLYPVPGVSAYPWPAAEFDATEEQAAELLAYIPPPFTVERPKATGGVVTPGAVFLVGESGPETVVLRSAASTHTPPSPPETAAEAPDTP